MTVPPSLLPLEPFPTAPDTRASTPHIRLQGLGKRYPGGVQALREIDLEIRRGEVFGIIGRSGAGKSSLIRTLNRLERPSEGQVLIDDEDIGGYDGQRLVALRRRIGMIFQHFNLMSAKTVWQNIALPLRVAGVPRARIEERVAGLLQLVGLEEKRDAYPAQLSGGQKQRVGIARALVHQPQILLCDEATSALDPESTQAILALLRDINRRLGLTIVLITHEMAVIREICDRVVVLECGRIVEQGEVWEVFGDPRHAAFSARLVLPSASFTSNQALRAAPSTFTRLELNASSAEYLRTYSISGGTKSATPNNAAPARSNSTSMSCSTPSRSQWSQDRYMAFCGAPAHLIGIAGWVNSALPPRRPRTSSQV